MWAKSNSYSRPRACRACRGFSLQELMIVLVIASLLVAVAVPSYERFAERAHVAQAVGDIGTIAIEIGKFQLRNNNALPLDLAELGIDIPLDPWDRPYVYVNIPAAGPGFAGLRKDKNLVPINTDFDLYSMGKDGMSAAPLSAKASRDDIVRANDGGFIGRGEDY